MNFDLASFGIGIGTCMFLIVIFAISVRIIFGGQVNPDPDAEVAGIEMSPGPPYIPRTVTPKPGTFKRQKLVYRSLTPTPVIKNKNLVATIGGGTNLGDLKYVDQNAWDEYNSIGRFG